MNKIFKCSFQEFKQIAKLNLTKIEDFYTLRQSVQNLEGGNWQSLGNNLEVDRAVMNNILHENSKEDIKRDDCLNSYFKSDKGSWEEVVIAVARPPFKHITLAKEIAKNHLHSPNNNTIITFMHNNC